MTARLGRQGEDLARARLEKMGYRILAQNYRVRFGEIDLIAVDQETLVFIEVKTRSGTGFGSPFEALSSRKQVQLSRVALEFVTRYDMVDRPARFDAVAVYMKKKGEPIRIEVIKNAFDLCHGV